MSTNMNVDSILKRGCRILVSCNAYEPVQKAFFCLSFIFDLQLTTNAWYTDVTESLNRTYDLGILPFWVCHHHYVDEL